MRRGDFHGEETLVLENEHLIVEALAAAGPRIVRVQLAGSSENVLGDVADVGWDTPWGEYHLRGGHRLWCAPENPPLTFRPTRANCSCPNAAHGVRLERLEPQSGLRKSMDIELATNAAVVTIMHCIRNEGKESVELAPWPITILPMGGVAILPQQKGPLGENEYLPNRALVLWPYSSIGDSRLELGDELFSFAPSSRRLRSRSVISTVTGWAAYLRAGVLFCKRIDPLVESAHVDMGSNIEVYCDDRVLELETQAPLSRLEPGTEAEHEERWELHQVGDVESSAESLSALVAELGLV